MASMRTRSARSVANVEKPLRKVKGFVKNCQRRCCEKNYLPDASPCVVFDSEPAELLTGAVECKYPGADILPRSIGDVFKAPFDIQHAEKTHYPCDKCHKRSPNGFYLRHNDTVSSNGLDDCWCDQCMVDVIAPFAMTDRDYLVRFMDQWTRILPRGEEVTPFASTWADQLPYACCKCHRMPENVAYRVKEDENVSTPPGIYCEPCANREIVQLVRQASEFEFVGPSRTRENLMAKGEEVIKRFEHDPELSKICSSMTTSFNPFAYSNWPPSRCQSCLRNFDHHAMTAYFMYIPQTKVMGVACHYCARNVKDKAILKFDGYGIFNAVKAANQSTPLDQLSGFNAPFTDSYESVLH
eukprot:jgi/Mesvir1/26693/Mv20471-RA.1